MMAYMLKDAVSRSLWRGYSRSGNQCIANVATQKIDREKVHDRGGPSALVDKKNNTKIPPQHNSRVGQNNSHADRP